MTVPASHFTISQRHRLHYLDWGNPEAPPLILLHGVRDHCANWDWVAEALCRDWHIIAPDLRGHGDSQWSTDGVYTIPGYVYDLAQLIRLLRLAPVTIVAHSLGGRIALRLAGIQPETVRKLAVIEGLGPPPEVLAAEPPMAERMRAWIEAYHDLITRTPRRYASAEDAIARMREQNPRLPLDKVRHLTLRGLQQQEDGSFTWKFDNCVRLQPPTDLPVAELEQIWSRITAPTLMLHGAESTLPNPIETNRQRQFPNARFEIIEDAGHWVHHDQLDKVVTTLQQFLP